SSCRAGPCRASRTRRPASSTREDACAMSASRCGRLRYEGRGMTLSMSRVERDAFLAETHVAILSVAEAGRGPLAVPVWYEYKPGRDVRIVTGGKSRKMSLLRAAGRATLCAQDETPPYRYVTVEGPIAFGALDVE